MGQVLQPSGLIQLPALAAHHSRRAVYATFVFVASGTSIGIITAVAYWSGHPLVVPSLGPTAFLVFNRSQSAVARPRNIVFGHLLGAIAGYVSLLAFGLGHSPSVLAGGLTVSRIGAAALSIALTSGAMIALRAEHGPAGATTLIVSLGFMTTLGSLGLLMAGVVGLAAEGVLIDRLVGLRLPFWSGAGSDRRSTAPLAVPRGLRALPPAGEVTNGHGGPVNDGRRRPDRRSSSLPSWLIGPGEGRRLQLGGEDCTVKVQDAHAGAGYSVLEVALMPGVPTTLVHAHYDFAESYYVLEGEVEAEVGADRVRVGAGSTLCLPVGASHLLTATGRRPARCLCITDRARHSDLEFLP